MPVWLMIRPPPIEGGRCAGEVSARPAYDRRSPLDGTQQPLGPEDNQADNDPLIPALSAGLAGG